MFRAATVIAPPSGIASAEFRQRFSKAKYSSSGSALKAHKSGAISVRTVMSGRNARSSVPAIAARRLPATNPPIDLGRGRAASRSCRLSNAPRVIASCILPTAVFRCAASLWHSSSRGPLPITARRLLMSWTTNCATSPITLAPSGPREENTPRGVGPCGCPAQDPGELAAAPGERNLHSTWTR